MVNIASKAAEFAAQAHRGQVRKYTQKPYITHCGEIVTILNGMGITDVDILAAAWLHDVVEDTKITFKDIEEVFGPWVMELVWWLTDLESPKHGNRATRKYLSRLRWQYAPKSAVLIKFADLISNSESIMEHDLAFAKVYIPEIRNLAETIQPILPQHYQGLYDRLNEILTAAEKKLEPEDEQA